MREVCAALGSPGFFIIRSTRRPGTEQLLADVLPLGALGELSNQAQNVN